MDSVKKAIAFDIDVNDSKSIKRPPPRFIAYAYFKTTCSSDI